ncbi:hypothetical protein MNB_SUP05-SYMBIONT-7-236 [hydrothermal vent metagenome]|uniref:Uncharacterized protein n=1 Tax=hydrothermal vent metagenome TaxID=652676 RepID=A0A1W1E5F4_9ZZZZ
MENTLFSISLKPHWMGAKISKFKNLIYTGFFWYDTLQNIL